MTGDNFEGVMMRMSPGAPPDDAPPDAGYRAAGEWLDREVIRKLRDHAVPLLRLSLAVVFVWFGVLKVTGQSPVGPLVAGTVPWLDPTWFVPALGAVEVSLGVGLLLNRARILVPLVLAGHLAGTFLTFLVQPGVSFRHGDPLLLTIVGEFVLKNVVLICAALVLAADPRGAVPPGTGRPSR